MRIFALLTIFFLSHIGSEVLANETSAKATSYLDPKALGECLSSLLKKQGGKGALRARLSLAAKTRQEVLKGYSYGIPAPQSWSVGAHLSYQIAKRVTEENVVAAISLVDPKFMPSNTRTQNSVAYSLFKLIHLPHPCNCGPVDRPDLTQSVEDFLARHPSFELGGEPSVEVSNRVLKAADPIARWLMTKPSRSVTHWELLKFATSQFDGDVLTAVGVLAELFTREAQATAPKRLKYAVLSRKLVKLVDQEERYNVGHNYHFWRLLAASLQYGSIPGRIYSRMLDNKEYSYALANTLSSDVAEAALFELTRRGVTCPFDGQRATYNDLQSLLPSAHR
ncbi:MAG: hypothetical protein AB7F86_17790 [Bdellovibrionales bacterium]